MKLECLEKLGLDLVSNPITIKNVIYRKISREIIITLSFKYPLKLKEYCLLKDEFKKNFCKDAALQLFISYDDENIVEAEILEYLKYIVNYLSKESINYSALIGLKPVYSDHSFIYTVPKDALGLNAIGNRIEEEFLKFGLHINVELVYDESISIENQMKELQQEQLRALDEMANETKRAQAINQDLKKTRYSHKAIESKICEIPQTSNDLSIFANQTGLPFFEIKGTIFDIEQRPIKTSTLLLVKMTDETDSIMLKKWINSKDSETFANLKVGMSIRAKGKAEYDIYERNVVIIASEIEILPQAEKEERRDDAKEKRVELHCHSKLSDMDGLCEPKEFIDTAIKWGHKALAITDHNGVYNIPEIDHSIPKGSDFKPIFGVELDYVDDTAYFISFNKKDIPLADATYVVFDLETTGLRKEHDEIIEIAATKYKMSGEVATFETFVKPKKLIPAKITEITSITDEMVADAPSIEEILPKFLEFCQGSILVAHNASFDVNVIYAQMRKLGLEFEEFPVIDTLNAFRALHFKDVKRFNLKELAKFYKVKQEHHHRAIDDTRVTAECFVSMLQEIMSKGITNYNQIMDLVDDNEFFKAQIPNHINILVKNQAGLKNMYRLLSDALTVHCFGNARLLKTVLDKYRDGILVGSGCVNGEVFQEALLGSYEKMKEKMKYYDYIEVQPPRSYYHLFNDMPNGEEVIKDIIKQIIRGALELNKIVVATSDAHYIDEDMHRYRDILINFPQNGGGQHPLARYNNAPYMHLRTTEEMLDEFKFLDDNDLAYQIVVTNTNLIADSIERVQAFPKEMFAPHDDEFKESLNIPSIVEEMKRIVKENEVRMYGENPHQIVTKRLNRELNSIISNGYSSVYYMAHLLVTKSLKDGYLVGSRGSVGSSLVATMMKITEINPLSPHYRCKNCKFQTFKMNAEEKNEYGVREEELRFQTDLDKVESGYDLPDAVCPICGSPLTKDGHDIPFETFLGFNGDKVPDIDLNFSGDYQAIAHEYVREIFGSEHAFRGGTISKLKDNTSFGYVNGYCERKGVNFRKCEIDRLAQKYINIKRSTGQHPGGIIVVPKENEIYDVTPVQYPANNTENAWRTTHFDYHSFENNLLKLDILGHDDPTIIKYLMDYVHLHQEDFPFDNPEDIPIDDKNIYKLFSTTNVIGVSEEDIMSPVASYAVPELGTPFVRRLLYDTLPKTFAELVKISGLSHGTGVWVGNSQDLVLGNTSFGKIPFSNVIGCRDDIMVYLMYQNLEPIKAFEIMEFVRKGKVKKNPEKWVAYREYMLEKKVPDWYIWSCEQIEYMFPKAHATAYVLMGLRIAWFKVYAPKLFYSAWFSKRAKAYSVKAFMGGKPAIKAQIEEIMNNPKPTNVELDVLNTLYVALEMTARGIKFLPLDIKKSEASTFTIEEEGIRIPFMAVDGLGESVALAIERARNERPFSSIKDVKTRGKLSETLLEKFRLMKVFGDLPEEDAIENLGLFAL